MQHEETLIERVEDVVADVVADIDPFPPKPGGLVDQARRRKAAEQAREAEGSESVIEVSGRNKVRAVRTAAEAPDVCGVNMVTLGSANPWSMLMPQDDQRRSAVIVAVDNDVVITADQGTASMVAGGNQGTLGFYLPAGIAVPLDTRAEMWVACTTTATNSRVSIIMHRESIA